MDRTERYYDPDETLRIGVQSYLSEVWTCIPGFVVKFPGSSGAPMTVDVQPAVNGKLLDPLTGLYTSIKMPVILDCVLKFYGGGGVTATFPIKANDECLVFFSSRDIDGWWSKGVTSGPSDSPTNRTHDLSDGFAMVGVRSNPNAFTVDTANACLITDDGQTYFKLNPTSKAVAVQASGGINLNGVTIDSSGNMVAPGNITSDGTVTGQTDVKNGVGTSLTTHYHTAGGPVPIPGS